MTAEGTFPKSDGDILYASEVNTLKSGWSPQIYSHRGLGIANTNSDTLVHSASVWTRLNDTATMRTTDGGVTWVAATTDNTNMMYGRVCTAAKAKAIAWKNSNTNVTFTADSGDTWTQASTDPAEQMYCLSFPTAAVAVMGGAVGGSIRSIWYSTDSGANWTVCTTGPTAAVYAISMFSATTGFAIADGGNIWKTTNGGVDWSDTGHTFADPLTGADINVDILAISATEFVGINVVQESAISYYDGSGNSTQTFTINNTASFSNEMPYNPIKLTNGNFIYGFMYMSTVSSRITLIKTTAKDSTNAQIMVIPITGAATNQKTTAYLYSSRLVEYDTNKIMLITNGSYMLIDTG